MAAMNGAGAEKRVVDAARYEDVAWVASEVRRLAELSESELPSVGIICGSGLGGLAATLTSAKKLSYASIPGFLETRVKGHTGELVFGWCSGRRVVLMAGRFHPYEGHDLAQCVLPVRVMRLLGARVLLITNAVGGINQSFSVGDLMIIKDHIAWPLLALKGPLMGLNDERLGPRFPSMNNAYDRDLRSLVESAASSVGVSLRSGVYAMVGGPQFETPAELRGLATLGVDAVGMSVAHETVAARHAGLKVVALSLITNIAQLDPDSEYNANLHDEVLEAGRKGAEKAAAVVKAFLQALPENLD